MQITGIPLTGFEIAPGPFGLVLTLRFFESADAQERGEETVMTLEVPPDAALELAKQLVNAEELRRMPSTASNSVN